MKKSVLILFAALLFTLRPVAAQEKVNEITVSSKISGVTVFMRGAQISRAASVQLPAGTSVLTFAGLSPHIVPASISVEGKGAFTVLSVSDKKNFIRKNMPEAKIKALYERKDALLETKIADDSEKSVLVKEQEMIIANQSIGGTAGLTADQLRSFADFYRLRLKEIAGKLRELDRKTGKLNEQINDIDKELRELNASEGEDTGEILVKVDCKTAGKAELNVSYLSEKAAWVPVYDIRAEEVGKPLNISYKAEVYQLTGEDWNEVNLTLSSADPSEQNIRPELSTWYLARQTYAAYGRQMKAKAYEQNKMQVQSESAAADDFSDAGWDSGGGEEEEPEPEIPNVTISEATTEMEFNIERPYTLLSDGEKYTVEMKILEMPADYEYYCAPKIRKDAYLTARVTDFAGLGLLRGEATLFFGGKYLGKTLLDPSAVSDTLEISLGADKSVIVRRERLTNYSKKQFLGSNKTETRAWEISVKNGKQKDIRLILEDQIPVSTMGDTEVTAEQLSGADHDKTTGKLRWEMKLGAGENRKVSFRYLIKSPKRYQLILE